VTANRAVDEAAERAARDPGANACSACVLVVLDRTAGERAVPGGVTPLEGSAEAIAAGADEAILVVSPITERSIRAVGDALAALDR
jgi:hypothetical protein